MLSRIIHGNSLEILKSLPSESVHALITDIPYGIGLEDWDILHANSNSAYCGSSEAQERAGKLFKRRGKPLNGWRSADRNMGREYGEWCAVWGRECLRLLKPGASCLVFAGRRFAHRFICAFEDAGFTFKDELAWEKDFAPQRAQRLSRIYARREDRANAEKWLGWRVANLRPIFEPIFWFQKPYRLGGTIADNIMQNGVGAWNEDALLKYNKYERRVFRISNIIRVESQRGDRGLHSAQKPLQLMELLVTLVTCEDQLVLDPFMGSGTTLVAAKKLKRAYIGIDIDERNVRLARERIKAVREGSAGIHEADMEIS